MVSNRSTPSPAKRHSHRTRWSSRTRNTLRTLRTRRPLSSSRTRRSRGSSRTLRRQHTPHRWAHIRSVPLIARYQRDVTRPQKTHRIIQSIVSARRVAPPISQPRRPCHPSRASNSLWPRRPRSPSQTRRSRRTRSSCRPRRPLRSRKPRRSLQTGSTRCADRPLRTSLRQHTPKRRTHIRLSPTIRHQRDIARPAKTHRTAHRIACPR
jgi:hypothetical protein